MNIDPPTVIIDDGPILEREDRPRSRTWPILPPPIETIHEHERDAEIAEPPPIIEEDEAEEQACSEQQKPEPNPRKNSRKNAWGNLSYADLITRAIQSSPEQRLTLSQIYEWMVRNIPYFKDKGDSTSSAGWKNSIRHNLSLHSRFMRVQNDNNGKSSYWVINPDAKPGKASRRRSCSIDGQPKDKKRRSKKLHQSTDDISALSPNAMKLKHQNRSFDNLLSVGSPCSSTDSLSNLDDFSNELVYPYNSEAFARPRSTSNVSNVSSISGRMTPTQLDIDDLDTSNLVVSGGAEETANMVESMSIDGQQHRNISATINLNESLKIVNNGSNTANQEVSPVRQHSDSFGSADSGYESPAYFPSQQPQNRNTLGKHTSPVPAKPPPPYNQPFNQMNRQAQQPMFAGRMNYYSQQASQPPQQSQNRLGHVNNHLNHAPRLTHLPMQSQPSFPQHQNSLQQQFVQQNHFTPNVQQMNPGHGFENFMATTSSSIIAPNVTMDSKINMASQFQQQHQQMRKPATQNVNVFGANMMDIPDDLHQVKLCGFADQQQLASDLDAIIRNELRDSSRNLQGICGPVSNSNDSNNNSNPLNIQTSNSFPLTGQNWVR